MTTRVCHSATLVQTKGQPPPPAPPCFVRDVPGRVMIPAYARPAHHRLRAKLAEISAWNETDGPTQIVDGERELGIITAGISYQHVREAAPHARVLKIGLTFPCRWKLCAASPPAWIAAWWWKKATPASTKPRVPPASPSSKSPRCTVFGELNVSRVRRIVAGDVSPEPALPAGKPPELLPGLSAPKRVRALRDLNCIVAGDNRLLHPGRAAAFFRHGHMYLYGARPSA